ncbi:type III-B CRISPR-associated protein Cas10/Cmr2 [Pontibacter sp. G13]|uniref:type III-B CRISPR-associated protein Cas10/Cmr2 n=1 Tax=Pontibacter sp. G13 TaxID=3074898 RepID=UPI00288A1142|nr:type III-B CRISPR-associated protein Cas10/Cmr2 [Pontibacter sp. G13]WNJ18623.1 type III-B CRISPR-associated protein Cas10/Cmr2 [Pontibacter sp. G13]
MKYLFLFTIGPVQSFIAQARKTKDLFAGSMILSELIGDALKETQSVFKEVGSAQFIFPAFDGTDTKEALPNRFLVEVDLREEVDLRTYGNRIEQFVRTSWAKMGDEALERNVKGRLSDDFHTRFNDQMNGHLEVYWIFQPIGDDGYAEAYKAVERNLGSVKNLRPFVQISQAGFPENHRKCSVSGTRDAVFFREKDKPAFAYEDAAKIEEKSGYELNIGEGLSAPVFTKRFFKEKAKFHSTAEIAVEPWKEKVKKCKEGSRLLESFSIQTGSSKDGQLYFIDNWSEAYLKKHELKSLAIAKEKTKEILKSLYGSFGKPAPYYALVSFDGDKMGEWLNGISKGVKEDQLMSYHQKLSALFSKFAGYAKEYVDQGRGKTVYAGGDDFLGFLHVNTLLETMEHLRVEFNSMVADPIKSDYGIGGKDRLSFSVGIIIAHYKMPLNSVVQQAKEVEKVAKKKGGRDAFAIRVIKHSGEINEMYAKWEFDPDSKSCKAIARMNYIIHSLKEKRFSNKYISSITQTFQEVFGREGYSFDKSNSELGEAKKWLPMELGRLVRRSKQVGTSESQIEEMVHCIQETFTQSKKVNADSFSIFNYIYGLHAMDFISRYV